MSHCFLCYRSLFFISSFFLKFSTNLLQKYRCFMSSRRRLRLKTFTPRTHRWNLSGTFLPRRKTVCRPVRAKFPIPSSKSPPITSTATRGGATIWPQWTRKWTSTTSWEAATNQTQTQRKETRKKILLSIFLHHIFPPSLFPSSHKLSFFPHIQRLEFTRSKEENKTAAARRRRAGADRRSATPVARGRLKTNHFTKKTNHFTKETKEEEEKDKKRRRKGQKKKKKEDFSWILWVWSLFTYNSQDFNGQLDKFG